MPAATVMAKELPIAAPRFLLTHIYEQQRMPRLEPQNDSSHHCYHSSVTMAKMHSLYNLSS
jgi:hypothetical protein